MDIDVVVPTYNRSALLQKTIASLLHARIPEDLRVRILVVDNNSSDDTREVVKAFGDDVLYLNECRQGSSSARNAGISVGISELVGFVDDDEEVDAGWFEVIHREFQDPALDFIGGASLPNWSAPPPAWLPPGYNAAIGVVKPKPRAPMDACFRGNLNGGNAVLRRRVFRQVGLYSTTLGRSANGLLSEEDAEFYKRLIKAGVYGLHIPELIIYHHIPESRMTRSYHRKWAYWRAVSQGYLDREISEPVAYLLGIPRHMVGRAMRSIARMPRHLLSRGTDSSAFEAELSLWDLAGFAYGKHLINMGRFYTEKRQA